MEGQHSPRARPSGASYLPLQLQRSSEEPAQVAVARRPERRAAGAQGVPGRGRAVAAAAPGAPASRPAARTLPPAQHREAELQALRCPLAPLTPTPVSPYAPLSSRPWPG